MHSVLILSCIPIIMSIVSASNCSKSLVATLEDDKLPQPDSKMAVGYNAKRKIVVGVGGAAHPHQFFKFMVDPTQSMDYETFRDYNETHSLLTIEGSATYYAQVDDTLWILSASGDRFVTLNLDTYDIEQTAITFQSQVNYGAACLTSYEQYLFIVGGNQQMHDIQVYNITSGQWLANAPLLRVGRRGSSCAVVHNTFITLYSIGGVDSSGALLNTIETSFFNVEPGKHTRGVIMIETLPRALHEAAAVAYGSDILVVGGTNDIDYMSDIVVIHTALQSIDVCGSLAVAAAFVAPVIVDDTLYVFGGYNTQLPDGEWELSSYQKIDLIDLLLRTTTPPVSSTAVATTGATSTDKTPSPVSSTAVATTGATGTGTTALPALKTTTEATPSETSVATEATSSITTGATPLPTSTTSNALTTKSVTPSPVAMTTSDGSGKEQSDEDKVFKERVMIAIIAGSVIMVIIFLVVFLICKKRRRKVDVGGAYDEFLKDSYNRDQLGKDDYHRL